METHDLTPVWAAVGNIIEERKFGPGGREIKKGTKQFRSGARVYIVDAYWGMCDAVTVIGLPKKSHQFITLDTRAEHVENIRLKLVYKPQAIKALINYFGEAPDKKHMERICNEVPNWL